MLLSFLKSIGWMLFRVLFSVEFHGLENVPENGAVIVAGNHPSYLDPVLVGLPLKRKIRFMAWDALFKVPLLGPLISTLGAFPVDIRKGRGESAFLEARRILNEGHVLGIFPEGQRSEQGPMGELRTGVARLAIETGATIVPVTIGGAYRAWPKWKCFPKPAKIIIRFHEPLHLSEEDRRVRRQDRDFHQEVMAQVAAEINRSLTPSLRGADSIEHWYRQPPSHIRSYEWAPLIAVLIALAVGFSRGLLHRYWSLLVLVPALYYLYLLIDLTLIRPARLAKWVRNSLPIWLIFIWHYPLVTALGLPPGERNGWLAAALLAAFFPFFYEDYYTLQKFVRGIVACYYFSLALLLIVPHPLGTLVAILFFIAIFVYWYRVIYRQWIAAVMGAVLIAAAWPVPEQGLAWLAYAGLGLAVNAYLQTLVTIAYDIRRAGNVSLH
ncbi:MAG TPA: lysophospholipid acyltransferase family protein [Blastocatellia bacterium]|nr:lysophospholipid acyltransferase family protein [Blastocatellia bacterium]